MRAFTGVFPPAAIQRDLRLALEQGGALPRGRWVCAENLHLTLCFLGDVPSSRVGELRRAIEDAGRAIDPFELRLGGLGAFPRLSRPRVLFVRVREGADPLVAWAAAFREALPADLRPADDRPLRPHLTLARFRDPPPEEELRRRAEEMDPLRWRFEATEALLVESVLSPEGARYRPCAAGPFGRGSS